MTYGGTTVLVSLRVDTNEALKQRVRRLVDRGMSQKVLAGKMGLHPTQLSRWLRQAKAKPIPVTAMDGFLDFIRELEDALKPTAEEGTAGWPKGIRPGTLRHTFAIDLLLGGADLGDVQGLLGHADIQTTRQFYAPILVSRLKKAVGKRRLTLA